jgi:hypothetical protein
MEPGDTKDIDLFSLLTENKRYEQDLMQVQEMCAKFAVQLTAKLDDIMDDMQRQDEREGEHDEETLDGIYVTHRRAHIERLARLLIDRTLPTAVTKL